jgi:Lipase (class 3)
LATLCGFYAAMNETIIKNGPVVVVSIASPRVGNADFGSAFQTLEKMKRIQHLRVSNREDTVTLVPFVATMEAGLLSSSLLASTNAALNLYKHCGIHLKLKSRNPDDAGDQKKLFSLSYAKDKTDEEGTLPEDLRRSLVAAKSLMGSLLNTRADFKRLVRFHCCDEHERRLMMSKSFLDKISLGLLYADESLVGETVAAKETIGSSLLDTRKSSSTLKATSREVINAAISTVVA